jgi:hypothetical protein
LTAIFAVFAGFFRDLIAPPTPYLQNIPQKLLAVFCVCLRLQAFFSCLTYLFITFFMGGAV